MEIHFFPPEEDNFNTFSYVCNLDEKQRRILFNGLEVIKQVGFFKGMETKSIKLLHKKEKIYEFIIGNHRLEFIKVKTQCWILHGFLKKGQKTSKRDIQSAINLKYRLLDILNSK